jgi:hypothetical protein
MTVEIEKKRKKTKEPKTKIETIEKKGKKEKKAKTGIWTFEENEIISKQIVDQFLELNEIRITRNNEKFDINPILKFKQAGFPRVLRKSLEVLYSYQRHSLHQHSYRVLLGHLF